MPTTRQFLQLAQLAAQLCAAPIASLTRVHQGVHTLVAHTGPTDLALADLQTLAGQLAASPEPQILTLPNGSLGLCAATPVWTADAGCVAVLWVIDPQPHVLDAAQRTALTSLAGQVQVLLQLQASEQQYRALFEGNPLPMWVRELHSQRIVAVNAAAVAHYGYSQTEFLALTSCAENPTDADAEATLLGDSVHSLLRSHRRHRLHDGRVIDVEMSTSTVQFNGEAARMVMVNDITERLRAERSLARLGRAQRMLSACNEALVRAGSESALLHEVCRITVEIGGYKTAFVGFAQNDAAKSITLAADAGEIDPDMRSWPFSWSVD
ncbi:MAG: PAS domain S-box protein [Rhodoferax sp.]|uniref:PAS domain S-box protein n=2 Tax=Rhodoferax sp. TaxID=50421 RepID=UPI003263EB38